MPGKDPHRPEGKTKDAEHMRSMRSTNAHTKALDDVPAAHQEPHPTRAPAEEEIGGSRPGVESRVKRAIEERDG
jgi:hypothetical protein